LAGLNTLLVLLNPCACDIRHTICSACGSDGIVANGEPISTELANQHVNNQARIQNKRGFYSKILAFLLQNNYLSYGLIENR
jgi:hypothetical protein